MGGLVPRVPRDLRPCLYHLSVCYVSLLVVSIYSHVIKINFANKFQQLNARLLRYLIVIKN